MPTVLEDEFGDILQKARDGKHWSAQDLAQAVNLPAGDIARMERYEFIPSKETVLALARALDLDGPALHAIATESWAPQPVPADPAFELVCLDVFMGTYPVKCYLVVCPETREAAVVDTGANPGALVKKAKTCGVTVTHILLTHAHPDHAWGLDKLDRAFGCPAWIDRRESQPRGSRDLRHVQDGDRIPVGRLKVEALSTPGHTAGGISYKIGNTVLSGDCLFAGSMGRANSSWSDLYQSITRRLLSLPDDTRLHPGHGPATTVGQEKRHNPFFCGKI